jgi:hypothetical protein
MFSLVGLCYGMVVRLFRGRRSLLLENLALRQQLVALKRRHPRPSIDPFDKLFWVIARRAWSDWKHSLLIARNRSPLAPNWFSNVLAAHLQSPEAGRKKTGPEGGPGIDLSDGR